MKHLSLKVKTFLLLLLIVVFATAPLILYYVKTSRSLAALGADTTIESVLTETVDSSRNGPGRAEAALALKKYRQIDALKRSIVRQVLRVSLLYFAAVVLVALLVGYLFISRITRPLAELTVATRCLADDRFDYRLPENAGGEIGTLIESFNTMARNLHVARSEKLAAERKATWQRVARVIAHEIKNPLTPIRLSTERLQEKFINGSEDFPDTLKSTTSMILSEIGTLQKLVDTFHRYAKFPDPVLKRESLNEILAEACALFDNDAVSIKKAPDERIPPLELDRSQMREALTNLVKNACEAVAERNREGVVTVGTVLEPDKVRLDVEDNGRGIPPDHMEKLFQPYFTTREHGNGIGLALTERIVALHGGRITCESTEGRGTRFSILLPLSVSSTLPGDDHG